MAFSDAILGGLATCLILASLGAWALAIRRLRAGQCLIPFEPRRPVPWGFIDLTIALCLMAMLQLAARWLLERGGGIPAASPLVELPTAQQSTLVLASGCVSLGAAVLSLLAILIRTPTRLRDAGWDSQAVRQDLRLGTVAFVMLAPIAYGIQFSLAPWFESRHPLIQMIEEAPGWHLLAASVFSAVLVAPIVEEYLYRVLLQGWLEKLAVLSDSSRLFAGDPVVDMHGDETWHQPRSGPAGVQHADSGAPREANPYRSPVGMLVPPNDQELVGTGGPCAWWPVAVSALIFALLHWSNGPDWVALFVFALGLGYLYRQSHRVLPSIVAHLLLNACSMCALLIQVLNQPIMH